MSIKIYHNPRCSKSRQTLQILQDKGIEPEIIEYLKDTPSAADISAIVKGLNISDIREVMRKGEEPYKALDLANENKSTDELIKAIAENPILLERPVVITPKGIRLCRPPEKVAEIL